MASIFRNIVHGQEYGTEGKKKWTKCGVLIEKDGRFFVKLTHMPLAPNDEDGMFFSCFDADHNEKQQEPAKQKEGDENLDDDIPF